MKLGETALESPLLPLTSTVGGRQREVEHDRTVKPLIYEEMSEYTRRSTSRAYLTAADVQVEVGDMRVIGQT